MKNKIIILLTIIALGCNAQEPRLMFSVNYVDSLNQKILNQSIEIAVKDYLIDSSFNEITAKDSIILDYETKIDILNQVYKLGDIEYTHLDTITGAITTLKIKDKNKWYTVVTGETRYQLWIIDNILEIWLGYGNKSSLIVKYDLNNLD